MEDLNTMLSLLDNHGDFIKWVYLTKREIFAEWRARTSLANERVIAQMEGHILNGTDELFYNGQIGKIALIKFYRNNAGASLKESKDIVEAWWANALERKDRLADILRLGRE